MEFVALFLVLVALFIPLQHMAFGRHPKWYKRELARRAIGAGTVLGLALIPICYGVFDARTWAWLAVGFALSGVILFVMTRYERGRLRKVRRVINGQIRRWEGTSDENQ